MIKFNHMMMGAALCLVACQQGDAATTAMAPSNATQQATALANTAKVIRILPVDQVVDTVSVQTQSGLLVGEQLDDVNVFRGIPFAKPPVGDLRWRAPQKPEPWVGARTALSHEAPCPQPIAEGRVANQGGVIGAQSEDCLYLQVYAPKAAVKAPVMVWIHGGGMFLGSGDLGSYYGTQNAKQGVITVPINYRLGTLGSFAHPALSAEGGDTGSYSFMDAVQALEWVQDNIEQFGGDPDNVTIAGQSAGGFVISQLLTIPSAKGLYHKAVIQSGARIMHGMTSVEAGEKAVEALAEMGVASSVSADQLRAISPQTFAYNTRMRRGYGVIRDGNFIKTSPKEVYAQKTLNDVPILVGTNGGEGGFHSARDLAANTQNGAKSWLYRYNYVPDARKKTWLKGAIHSAEVMFSFDSLDSSSWGGDKMNAKDHQVAKHMQSCWIAFYKMSVSSDHIECADGFKWPAYNDKTQVTARLDESFTVAKSSDFPDHP